VDQLKQGAIWHMVVQQQRTVVVDDIPDGAHQVLVVNVRKALELSDHLCLMVDDRTVNRLQLLDTDNHARRHDSLVGGAECSISQFIRIFVCRLYAALEIDGLLQALDEHG
jgi:DNA polymerase III psi subunit